MSRAPLLIATVVALAWGLSACGSKEEVRLPGERISVLSLERILEPDPGLANLEVRLPPPQINAEWPQSGGSADHAMHHLAAGEALRLAWRVEIGEGSDDEIRLLSSPVTGGGRIFTTDAEGRVTAFDARTGQPLWALNVVPKAEADSVFSGGLAYADGRLVVTTGAGEVLALDAARGNVIWRHSVGRPMRAPPTLAAGRVFVITYDNQLFALSAENGGELWSHAGIAETAGLLGGAAPAVASGTVVVPYSSGELFAIAVESGRVLWMDSLSFQGATGGLATLNDIKGDPVIDGGVVYAISNNGRLVAIDLRTGSRVWEQKVSGLQTPWLAGDFLYVLASEGELICVSREDGRIRWVSQLPRYADPEDQEEPIFWSGPILAGDRLILVNTDGVVFAISPYTGRFLGGIRARGPIRLSPIVAQGTVYVLTEEAELLALR